MKWEERSVAKESGGDSVRNRPKASALCGPQQGSRMWKGTFADWRHWMRALVPLGARVPRRKRRGGEFKCAARHRWLADIQVPALGKLALALRSRNGSSYPDLAGELRGNDAAHLAAPGQCRSFPLKMAKWAGSGSRFRPVPLMAADIRFALRPSTDSPFNSPGCGLRSRDSPPFSMNRNNQEVPITRRLHSTGTS